MWTLTLNFDSEHLLSPDVSCFQGFSDNVVLFAVTLVFSLLGVFCALGVLLTGLLVYGGRLRFELPRRHLTRTLVTDPTVCAGT